MFSKFLKEEKAMAATEIAVGVSIALAAAMGAAYFTKEILNKWKTEVVSRT